MLTEKDYCDYETCVALKEKGFPQHITEEAYIIDNYGEDEYDIGERLPIPLIPDYMDDVAAPTIYEAQKWLREKENIIVEVFVDDDSDTPITYNIYKDRECVCHHHGKYWSVEEWSEALSEGIKEAIKHIEII